MEKKQWHAEHRKQQNVYAREYRARLSDDERMRAAIAARMAVKREQAAALAWWAGLSEKEQKEEREYCRRYFRASRKTWTDDKKLAKTEYVKLWKRKHPEHIKKYRQADQEKSPERWLFHRVRWQAKMKNIPFNLTLDDVVIPERCPVLGIPIVFPAKPHSPGLPSFDRIDPKQGYVKGNVKIISLRANKLKNDCIDPEELRAVADYIEQHRTS